MNSVRRIYIHKVPVDIVHPQELPDTLATLSKSKTGAQIVFIRSWDLVWAHYSPIRLKILNDAALVLPVSRMIRSMARFLRQPSPHCYYPFDTIIRMLTWLESVGGSLFFLGGKNNTVIEQNLRLTFPKARILGRYPGFFSKNMGQSVAMAISKANPDILLSGTGISRHWIYHRKHILNKGIILWNPEWFDFVLRRRNRPVKTAIARGHEWIFELYMNPLRAFRMPLIWDFWLKLILVRLFR